jgi:hypothetical protein
VTASPAYGVPNLGRLEIRCFRVVDVAGTAWNLEIENKLAKQIESFV